MELNNRTTVIALFWGALGTLLFTIVYASSKLTGGEISVFQIMFIRYVSGFVALISITKFRRIQFNQLKSQTPSFHLYRSLCGALGGVCIIHASFIAPIADVTALGLTDSLLTVILSAIFLREVVSAKQWFGGLLCGTGALVVLLGSTDGELFDGFSLGLWLALLGALLIAIESILIKVLTFRDKPLTILLYVNFFSMMFLAIPALYAWSPPTAEQWVFFLLLGPIAIFAQYCWVIAYKLEDVAIVTPINYSWIVFAGILGFVFFDEHIGLFTLLGSICIVVGGVILARSTSKTTESK